MPLTGSETVLKGFILAESAKLLGDPTAIPNLDASATALSNAIVKWITTAGVAALVAPAPLTGIPIPPAAPPAVPVTPGGPVIIPTVIADIK